MWPRKRDRSFNIPAITDHLCALVAQELSRAKPALHLPGRVSAAASGLHVVHLAGVRLGVLASGSNAETLVTRVEDGRTRQRIEAHLLGDGLTSGDMRALSDAAGLSLGTSNRIDDHDPLEPIDDLILTVLRVGKTIGSEVEQRYVLILDHRGNEIDLADPAGEGLTTMTSRVLGKAWTLGAARGKPWVGTISASRAWPSRAGRGDAGTMDRRRDHRDHHRGDHRP
jgi:hypothetical protein